MQCKNCKYPDSHVVQVYQRDLRNIIERRRECLRCGFRYTTHEKLRDSKPTKIEKYASGKPA